VQNARGIESSTGDLVIVTQTEFAMKRTLILDNGAYEIKAGFVGSAPRHATFSPAAQSD